MEKIMKKKKNITESLITELAFNLILDSEESEGFGLDLSTVDATGAKSIAHIDRDAILNFLEDDNTKVSIHVEVEDEDYERAYLIAENDISNESIRISGLKDHYLALIDAVYQGNETWKKLKQNPNTPLLSHDFVKHINMTHQRTRKDEVGIANYRRWKGDAEYRMLYGDQPHEVVISSWYDGRRHNYSSLGFAKSAEVESKMTELINWVNTVAFKDGRDIMRDLAEFHARFIKIHPFGDGNGRTARLLTNYLLIALGQSMITIPVDEKEDYCLALNYANSENLSTSADEILNFKEYIDKKFALMPGELKTFDTLEKERTSGHRYDDLANFFRTHQVPQSAKTCVKQILNNYGMKNIGERINIGRLKAEMMEDASM